MPWILTKWYIYTLNFDNDIKEFWVLIKQPLCEIVNTLVDLLKYGDKSPSRSQEGITNSPQWPRP